MKASRWPALLLIPVLLAAMVLLDGSDDDDAETASSSTNVSDPGRRPDAMPLAAAFDAEISTWYCPVVGASPDPDAPPPPEPSLDDTTTTTIGDDTTTSTAPETTTTTTTTTDTDDAEAIIERTVLLLTNAGDDARSGQLRLFGPDGPASTEDVSVPAASRWQQELVLDDARPGAALVELDGGGVAASLVVEGPHGSTVTPCLSQPAASWYLPSAATGTKQGDAVVTDARAVLHLFNPFPDDAIVEISFFVTDEAPRVPTGFDAYPVPAGSVVAIELGVGGIESARPQFATSVRARSGQIVAALVQEYDGSQSAEGLAVVPGAPEPALTWFFPAGRWNDRTRERFVLYNPGDEDALVALTVALDDPATNGSVAPFELTVPAGGYVGLGSSDPDWGRVPPDTGHSVSVRSQNDRPVVAVQRVTVSGDDGAGVALAMGSPLAATDWIVPIVDLADTNRSVTILNPSPLTRSRVQVAAFAAGDTQELPEIELAEAARAVIEAASVIELEHAGAHTTASEAVVVASGFVFAEGGRAWMVAVPVAGTTVALEAIAGAAGSGD